MLLGLMQLVSPALPIGAYSYSEGLEALVSEKILTNAPEVLAWLHQVLKYGAIPMEAGVMLRVYDCAQGQDWPRILAWNQWLSAIRETEELRQQSWQMGRSLLKLAQALGESSGEQWQEQWQTLAQTCNFAVAYGLVAQDWQLERQSVLLGYLHSWVANLISAAVRLIPLGQTQGQQLLWQLRSDLLEAAEMIQDLEDDQLQCCSWGSALASMAHETQYSRLFRS